ncbi:armadillo repeat-containing protein 7-like isoform X2 [Teleopsis dalmanni]|uniref:armadillo repeat-containing protein 7-like isoform X2 n=1 Tax=Teleopsis dalmanni TaxID=139649 RepID=UPI0018CE6A87|nr:armadillo repeat-containing protein 7-like isoform X2 [Teleopsis dalmanni]
MKQLKRKTPANGINRREFIEHLVEEYHTTTNIEAKEQVTANLANFAYDPINWKYLKDTKALYVFMEVIPLPNERLQLHALAGLCNICLDAQAKRFITKESSFTALTKLFLETQNSEIIINFITLFHQLLTVEKTDSELKQIIATPDILKRVINLRQQTADQRIKNLCIIFLEDFGSRIEIHELPTISKPNVNITEVLQSNSVENC